MVGLLREKMFCYYVVYVDVVNLKRHHKSNLRKKLARQHSSPLKFKGSNVKILSEYLSMEDAQSFKAGFDEIFTECSTFIVRNLTC